MSRHQPQYGLQSHGGQYTGTSAAPKVSFFTSRTSATSDASVSGAYGVGAGVSVAEGLGFWVNSLKSRGPAEAGGLLRGDLIVNVDGQHPESLGGLRKMLLGPKGTKVEIGVRRGGSFLSVVVERGGGSMAQTPLLGIGMSFKHLPNGGYVVTNVNAGGPAERAGVRSEDVICLYNGENLTQASHASLSESLANNTDPIVRFGVRRGSAPTLLSVVVVRTPLTVACPRDQSAQSGIGHSAPNSQFSASQTANHNSLASQAPVLGSGAATYSSDLNGIREFLGSVAGYNSSYDSELSDNYTSGSSRYASQRGSFLSDASREGYSSDECRSQPSPHTYVGQQILSPHSLGPIAGGDSRDRSQSPLLRPSAMRSLEGGLGGTPHSVSNDLLRKEALRATRAARKPHDGADGQKIHAQESTKDVQESSERRVSNMDSLDRPSATEVLRELKEQMDALNSRVERRLAQMETQINVGSSAIPKSKTEDGAHFVAHAGRYESDMKLALQSEVKRQETEQERANAEMARRQTMEKYRQEHDIQHEAEKMRVTAELRRQEAERERTSQTNELRTILQTASQAEKDRRQLEDVLMQLEDERAAKISRFERELNRIVQEHDGMLEGFDEMKRLVKESIERMEESLKKSEHEMYLELNKVRSQVFEAISRREQRAVVISTNSPATVIEGQRELVSIDSPRASGTTDASMDDDYGAGKRSKAYPRPARDADQLKNETMPFDGQRSPPSPLVPRLRLKRCMTDDAVPSSLRCATIVVGRRLFLFPKGRDGMCDLQYAMVMDLVSLRLWALRVMGSMPLRCRCNFFVVDESVCVFPCDANGRTDLKEVFILASAEEDRVYSQGCFVETDVPSSSFIHCQVVGRNCLIFCQDEEHNYDLERTCVLDTELLTLCKCGKMMAPSPQEFFGAVAPPKCVFVTVGFKIILFMQDASLHQNFENIWLVDINLGMARQRVELSKSFSLPRVSEAAFRVVGKHVYIFLHDNRVYYNFDTVCVLDTVSGALSPVKLNLNQSFPRKTRAQILVLEPSHLLVIPETDENGVDFSRMSLIDTTNSMVPIAEDLDIEVTGLPLQDLRFYAVGKRVYIVPGARARTMNNVVAVLSPLEDKCQSFAADIVGHSHAGFDVERSGSELIFMPFDNSGRRCIGEASILDCSLLH